MQLLKPIVVALALLANFAAPAFAQDNLHSFAAPAFDARHGGDQTNLEELRVNPAAHYRSVAVYEKALAIISGNIGIPLTDDSFRQILVSDRVSVAACADVFLTEFTLAAVDDGTNAYWITPRQCDPGEQIVMLDGIPIMSLACLNPIKLPEMDCLCGTVYYEWRQQHPRG